MMVKSTAASLIGRAPYLLIDHNVEARGVLLRLEGRLDFHTVLALRDAAFTAIGARPPHLCLDLALLPLPDASGVQSLVTIARVARLVDVQFTLIASDSLAVLLRDTGLGKTSSLDGNIKETGK